jgi:uncharacterized DUF497 family protein
LLYEQADAFERSDTKAARNAEKHLVRFEVATLVFSDASRVDIQDARADYEEERRIVLGMVQGVLLYVAYTMRGRVGRIISARPAHTTESDAYHGKIHARQNLKARFQRQGTVRPKSKR